MRFKKGLTILSIYSAAIFLLLELGLRIFLPFEKKRTRYFLTREVFQYNPANIHFDPEIGFFNNSNLNISFNSPEFRTKMTTNSLGFRDSEKSLINPAILLLGDSFGFGWGVEDGKTCADFLEKLTGKSVLNMSVSGVGTIQEYLLLRRFTRDRDIRGKRAIFLFCPNDLRDNISYGLSICPELYLDENGSIQYREISQNDFAMWFSKTQAVRLPLIYRYSYLAYRLRSAAGRTDRIKNKEKPKPDLGGEEEQRIFELAIQDIKSFSDERGIDILFVYIPMDYVLPGNDERIFNIIKTVLEKRGVPILDLRKVLIREDYWHYDDHWREKGHFKAAEAIRDFLNDG